MEPLFGQENNSAMDTPIVSICIPTYKQTKYLAKCLASVLTQQFTNYELIISDDTPDDTVENFIRTFNFKTITYRYYHNPHALGSPENWNNAISKARGKYIKILHHDDYFTRPDSLHKFVALLENSTANIGFSSTQVWEIQTDTTRIHRCSEKIYKRICTDPYFLFFKNKIGAPSAVIYKNGLNITFDKNLKWLVDVDFYINMLTLNSELAWSMEPLVCTAHGAEGQITQAISDDKQLQIYEHIYVFNKLYRHVSKEKSYLLFFEDLFRHYEIKSIQELNHYFPITARITPFFQKVFQKLDKNVLFKRIVNRFYRSRYNYYIFKLEKY